MRPMLATTSPSARPSHPLAHPTPWRRVAADWLLGPPSSGALAHAPGEPVFPKVVRDQNGICAVLWPSGFSSATDCATPPRRPTARTTDAACRRTLLAARPITRSSALGTARSNGNGQRIDTVVDTAYLSSRREWIQRNPLTFSADTRSHCRRRFGGPSQRRDDLIGK